MQEHLAEISATVAPDAHAILIYDDIVAHCCPAWNDLVDQPLAYPIHRQAHLGRRVLMNARCIKERCFIWPGPRACHASPGH